MGFETILTNTDDGVTTITLNRPERMNAWNETMASEMSAALETAEADDAVRGPRSDLVAGPDLVAELHPRAERVHRRRRLDGDPCL